MTDDSKQSPFEHAAAFQKGWAECLAKTAQAAFSATPQSAPPEVLKQMRNGLFEALAKSWEEFMRSPQFLEAVKGMMDNAIAFKKLTSEMLTKAHHEMQGTARTDIDTILLSVRHLENRLIDRMDELGGQLTEMRSRLQRGEEAKGARARTPENGRSAKAKKKSSRRP